MVTDPHMPSRHGWPIPHALSQDPQLWGSFCVITQ